nr:unnamed protein product [Callosobruchus chinensis]
MQSIEGQLDSSVTRP